jgi:hypothetical protein
MKISENTKQWIEKMYTGVDNADEHAFGAELSENCVLKFGNQPEMKGRSTIVEGIGQFFSSLKGLSHHFTHMWEVDDEIILDSNVTYTRLDDQKVTVPAVTIIKQKDLKADEMRIYVDLAPLYA